jgi:hypothetical protein
MCTELVDTVKRHEAGGAPSDGVTCLTVRLAAHAVEAAETAAVP